MIAGTHRLTSLWTRQKNEYVRRKMIQHAINGDSFKKLDREWTETANMRIRLEQRLLFLEFQKRGQCPCEDVYLPQLSDLNENEEDGGGSVLASEKSKGLNADHENMKQVYQDASTTVRSQIAEHVSASNALSNGRICKSVLGTSLYIFFDIRDHHPGF